MSLSARLALLRAQLVELEPMAAADHYGAAEACTRIRAELAKLDPPALPAAVDAALANDRPAAAVVDQAPAAVLEEGTADVEARIAALRQLEERIQRAEAEAEANRQRAAELADENKRLRAKARKAKVAR